jgi:hypothetical protein
MPYRQCEYKEEINGYIMPTFILILRTYAAVLTQPSTEAFQLFVHKLYFKLSWLKPVTIATGRP